MDIVLSKALKLFTARLEEPGRTRVFETVAREAQDLQALPAGPDRAREVHRRVEAAVAPFAALKPEALKAVRCHKGCSHCCRVRVELTADEADLLAERIRAGLAHPDQGRLALQRTWDTAAAFVGRPRAEADCVFLGPDGACTVYEDRPSVCRAVLVASDPELCREAQATTQVLLVLNPYLETVVSAAQTLEAWEGRPLRWMALGLAEALSRQPQP